MRISPVVERQLTVQNPDEHTEIYGQKAPAGQ
jgi:hypothetical protein